MKKAVILVLFPILLLSCVSIKDLDLPTRPTGRSSGLDEKTIIAGLKEALQIGTKNAVKFVSKTDGYYGNLRIKIPMPKELSDVEKVLRKFGLGKKVDEFVQTMNRGAEKAAPEAVDIFVDAISDMSVSDAVGILRGSDDEATRYFERKTRSRLFQVFLPIVKKVLDKVGVTSLYKFIVSSYNNFSGGKRITFDIDAYVTNKALDGLFVMVADEEKKIRKDPAARVTALLRKVFK